jgi:hypothetical protein
MAETSLLIEIQSSGLPKVYLPFGQALLVAVVWAHVHAKILH